MREISWPACVSSSAQAARKAREGPSATDARRVTGEGRRQASTERVRVARSGLAERSRATVERSFGLFVSRTCGSRRTSRRRRRSRATTSSSWSGTWSTSWSRRKRSGREQATWESSSLARRRATLLGLPFWDLMYGDPFRVAIERATVERSSPFFFSERSRRSRQSPQASGSLVSAGFNRSARVA